MTCKTEECCEGGPITERCKYCSDSPVIRVKHGIRVEEEHDEFMSWVSASVKAPVLPYQKGI